MPKTKLNPTPILIDNSSDIKDAQQLLGRGWSEKSVRRRIEAGQLIQGVHWVNHGTLNRRLIKLNKSAIERDMHKWG